MKDKHVLITGGSRGLGAALAEEFSKLGARVSRVARHDAELPYDISDKQAIYRLVGEATAEHGPVDVLINNASSLGPLPMPLLLDLDCEDLEAVLATNLTGAFRLTKAVLGNMVLRGAGTVINISSDAAVEAYPHWGAYSVSKAALDQMTRVWAAELKDTGVRMLSIDPGEMDTQMHSDAMPDADRSLLPKPREVAQRIVMLLAAPELPIRVSI